VPRLRRRRWQDAFILEDQLEEALRVNAEYRRAAESANRTTAA
jgi:hypothetical protein